MLDFILVSLPRSGSTWASNWLTTNETLCIHDPLYHMHYEDWDRWAAAVKSLKRYKKVGVACTGIWRSPDFLLNHPANKVILHRLLHDVNQSMEAIGLPQITKEEHKVFMDVWYASANRHGFRELFHPTSARQIWNQLMPNSSHWNAREHRLLTQMNIQPQFSRIHPNKEATRGLLKELADIAEEREEVEELDKEWKGLHARYEPVGKLNIFNDWDDPVSEVDHD